MTAPQINMEGSVERECSALGGLFQQIITDMKNGTPLWEDLVTKATKLHTCLRATIQAIAAYLDAFQKIADAATNTRGATKEIGTALTRICLRHKAVEARMKNFTSAIMDCLVVPLNEKIEDWKKSVINLDKEHAKEYKRARTELKKRSTDTLRLQKKARKGKSGELQRRVECSMQDVTERRQILEETEKQAVKAALIEERSRFCLFVAFMKPVVDEEVAMLSELSHLQEVVDQLQKHTSDPAVLPPASEQVIADLKGSESNWSFQTPPSSPSSLGSRKSSMCSISSLNSSSSGSTKSHHSPNHHYWHRSLSQQPLPASILRLSSVSSQDSGFTSQDVLFPRPPSAQSAQVSNMSEQSSGSNSSTPSAGGGSASTLPVITATWPNLQETLQFERAASAIMSERPHTISSGYERGHQRPPLTVYTFQAPEAAHSQPSSPVNGGNNNGSPLMSQATSSQDLPESPKTPQNSPQPIYARPPIPQRCSSLERPSVPAKTGFGVARFKTDSPKALPKQLAKVVALEQPQPMYVNMSELAHMAASKAQEMSFPPPPPEFNSGQTPDKSEPGEKDGSTSESSLESSSGYGSQTIPVDDAAHNEDMSVSVYTSLETASASKYCTLPRTGDFPQPGVIRRRPVSTAGYPSSTMRNTLLRRGSVQGHKPPPPIRRTSSISSSFRQHLAPVGGSMEHLPPPPAFLLEGGPGGGASVADAVRTLTELNHQPASPGAIRRSGSRSQSADRRATGDGLIAALSAKLVPVLSPRSSRRHSEDLNNKGPVGNRLLQELNNKSPVNNRLMQDMNNKSPSGNRLLQRGVVGPGQGFLQALNSKLAMQQQQHNPLQPKTNKIRQFISSRVTPDPTLCHESLMDQIKRGTHLKRTGSVNDRSAPKIR